ncbi:MAG: PucR family transcriptional regulator [Ruminococcaceae bacterium]|nr:PucR family transcriptional regulator [Oscillospiraceae bacterium]
MINKYLNSILTQSSKILGFDVGVIEGNGTVLSSNKTDDIEANLNSIFDACSVTDEKILKMYGYTFKIVHLRGKIDYIIFVKNGDNDFDTSHMEMLATYVGGMRQIHNDKYDKANFIKNMLADSILPGDIFMRSKELHLSLDVDRAVFALQYDDIRGVDVFDIISGIVPGNGKDFVIDLDNNMIAIVKEVKLGISPEELESVASQIVNTVTSEAMVNIHLGIGTVASNIKDIAKSYKEARIALEVGKVFDSDKYIMNYENLGIARLIYQLPTTLCELFLSEVFKKDSIDSLDQETLYTIQKFFENNLNVSETSRQLYVHRNTLVYRLDKVKKITGLDLRLFDHAIVFKVALMVKKYLVSKPMRI